MRERWGKAGKRNTQGVFVDFLGHTGWWGGRRGSAHRAAGGTVNCKGACRRQAWHEGCQYLIFEIKRARRVRRGAAGQVVHDTRCSKVMVSNAANYLAAEQVGTRTVLIGDEDKCLRRFSAGRKSSVRFGHEVSDQRTKRVPNGG